MTLEELLVALEFKNVEQLREHFLSTALLKDVVKVELEDQVYLDIKKVYFLPNNVTVIRVTGKSLVCSKGYHNLCPNAKSWCSCSCHKDDVEGLTPR